MFLNTDRLGFEQGPLRATRTNVYVFREEAAPELYYKQKVSIA